MSLLLVTAALIVAQPGAPAVDRIRFLPAPGHAADLLEGRFEGSNQSGFAGFQPLGAIEVVPPDGTWGELKLDNPKVYRWIRYVGRPGSRGRIAELELYAGQRKLTGKGSGYGSIVTEGRHAHNQAWDENPNTFFELDDGEAGFVGADLRENATARRPNFQPAPGSFEGPVSVEIRSGTKGAVIRYTLDGSMPTADHGMTYESPVRLEHGGTIQAVALLEGRAASPPTAGSYLVASDRKPGLKTFHLGNSLTQTTAEFAHYAATAGRPHESRIFARPGAWTKELWEIGRVQEKERWEKTWNGLDQVDHLTLQPRDFNIAEEAGYDRKFIDLFRTRSPDVQPWLYCEWVEKIRQRPTDRAQVPSRQMRRTVPALTWEESMGAMLLYAEDLREALVETSSEGKRPRVLPSALAMGWVKNLIDTGRFPGLKPGDFYPTFFNDQVHPTVNPLINQQGNGGYLVDLTWYAALYRESPEGKVLPVGTTFDAEQTGTLQRLAWDIIENYPDCGLYRDGTEPVGKPMFVEGPKSSDTTPVTLTSTTPGAWFRYTLDGTEPTRTRGYVYCGVISARRGMTIKAVAYRSGMADSAVAEITMP
jgi:hypothetical protein